jgi:predicted alpha/beta hydrolase
VRLVKLPNGALLETQKEKLARVFRRWARWSYSTNYELVSKARHQEQSTYTAIIPPSSTSIFHSLRWSPFPKTIRMILIDSRL